MNNCRLEEIIEYSFKDKKLLDRALTHSSFKRDEASEGTGDNERLEFLGDACLELIISEYLFYEMNKVDEGRLTKTRSMIVKEKSLVTVGHNIGLIDFINLGRSESHHVRGISDSIIADAVEAVIGAIFMDGGYQAAKTFVLRWFRNLIDQAMDGSLFSDYKTMLQEVLQHKGGDNGKISYVLDRSEGPDHQKVFYIHLEYDGNYLGEGTGKTKKAAEQAAAKAALERGV